MVYGDAIPGKFLQMFHVDYLLFEDTAELLQPLVGAVVLQIVIGLRVLDFLHGIEHVGDIQLDWNLVVLFPTLVGGYLLNSPKKDIILYLQ